MVFLCLRSYGQFGNSDSGLQAIFGEFSGYASKFDKANLTLYFRGLYITKVKDSISSYLVHKGISILEINAYLDELSEYMKERIEPTMADYGIELINFYVNDINVPENDSGVIKLKDALSREQK